MVGHCWRTGIGKSATCPPAPTKAQAACRASGSSTPRPRPSTAAASRSSARPATSVAGLAPTSSATATRCCARSSLARRPADRSGARPRSYAVDAHADGVRWAGAFPVDAARPLAVDDPGVGRRLRLLARRAARASSRPASPTSAASSARAPCCSTTPPSAPRAATRSDRRRACDADAEDDPHASADRRARPRARRARRRAPDRAEATELRAAARDRRRPRAGALRLLVRAVPALLRRLQGRARPAPALAALGFDVLYLPPIHPIGHTNRKGRNNTLDAGPDDPGSPWAIGDETGGHDAIHPELGTLEDFDALVAAASEHDIDDRAGLRDQLLAPTTRG